jgi:hypothetical protein
VAQRPGKKNSNYVSAKTGIGLRVTLFGPVAGIVAGVLPFTRR